MDEMGHGTANGDVLHRIEAEATVDERVTDPVCGMSVDPRKTAHHAEHAGMPYHFCSSGCRTKFVSDPQRYLTHVADLRAAIPRAEVRGHAQTSQGRSSSPGATVEASAPNGTIFTCPMHPDIEQNRPGPCPICGMALEPVLVSATIEPNHELLDMSRRLWIGAAATLPVVGLAMAGDVADLSPLLSPHASVWCQFILGSGVVLWAGWPFFVRGWHSVLSRHLNMFTLIALGAGVSWLFSVVATLAPGLFPPAFRGADGDGRRLLRSILRDRGPGASWSSPRIAGARQHERRFARTPLVDAEDSAGASVRTGSKSMFRWRAWVSATRCASGRERGSRSTVWSRAVRARWTSRW